MSNLLVHFVTFILENPLQTDSLTCSVPKADNRRQGFSDVLSSAWKKQGPNPACGKCFRMGKGTNVHNIGRLLVFGILANSLQSFEQTTG
jgi:hypothetical protein